MFRILDKLEPVRPFSEREAWGLFRLAAIGESVGWSLLIGGLLMRRSGLSGHAYAMPIAGQIHGTLFVIYFGILLATYSSLRWPRRWLPVAMVAGVVPYGTLLLEWWVGSRRKRQLRRALMSSAVFTLIG